MARLTDEEVRSFIKRRLDGERHKDDDWFIEKMGDDVILVCPQSRFVELAPQLVEVLAK